MYAYIFKVFIESTQAVIEVLNMAKRKKSTKKSKKRVAKQRLTFRKLILYFVAALVITLAAYIGYCFVTLPNIEEAVMRYMSRSASPVFLAQLEDMLHVEKMQNLPGTDHDKHPNWRRKIPVNLEDLSQDIAYIRCIGAIKKER